MSTFPPLDSATLCFAIAIYGFMMSGIAISARSAATAQAPALVAWSRGMFAGAIAFTLWYFRGYAPLVLTFTMANAMLVLVPAFCLVAQAELFRRAVRMKLIAAIAAIGIAGALAVTAFGLPLNLGIAMIAGASAVPMIWTVWLLAQESLRRKLPAAAFGAAIAALTAVGLCVRTVMAIANFPSVGLIGPGEPAPMQLLFPLLLHVVGSSMAFFAMVHACQREETLEKSRRDGLTGVYTRAAFFELTAAHLLKPADHSYAVVMVDVDHFKTINDTYDHRGGDLVLSHVAQRIAAMVRHTDIVGRYGGEEFCILLRSCDATEASRLAIRVVEDARQQAVRLDDGRWARYTLSAGYAISSPAGPHQHSESLTEILARADRALYMSKRTGRDQALPAEQALLPVELLV